MNWLAVTQTTGTGDWGKHGIITLFPCLSCDNLVLKKCRSLCLEAHCHNDWWLQNCWLQHLECFVLCSFKCLQTKGQKKVFFHLRRSSFRSVVRRPQTYTAYTTNMHNAEEDRAIPSVRVHPGYQKHEAFANGAVTEMFGAMPFLYRHLWLY